MESSLQAGYLASKGGVFAISTCVPEKKFIDLISDTLAGFGMPLLFLTNREGNSCKPNV